MHRLVTQLWERHRPAVLLVTHDVDEALMLADRVLVLDEGRVAHEWQSAPPTARSPEHPQIVRSCASRCSPPSASPSHHPTQKAAGAA